MRVFIYSFVDKEDGEEETKWVADERHIRVIAKRLFLDGEPVEKVIEEAMVDNVSMIVPRKVEDQYFQGGQFVYEAEEVHLYTNSYFMARSLVEQFAERFGEEKEMAIRIKEVGKE
ncbi:MAG: hypothetical protein JHC26_11640 [Thermofilum sp.]|uniref:hypothetical protein n=1 Tax=Thermofilum sp. TaxID=1961369 RepID=UPI00258E4E33|nr:hypothetical protein [Thermofilum sp.]MCI4409735.1 hypothetical protein [Thermofilum sp.]